MHNRVAVKSPHCWDDQNLTTWKFTNNEFVASVIKHMADQDEPACSNSPTWNFPPSGIGWKPETPFNIQEFRMLLMGVHTHDVEEGMTDGEMLQSYPEESSMGIWSVVTTPTAAAQEARENSTMDELRQRFVEDYPRIFGNLAKKAPAD